MLSVGAYSMDNLYILHIYNVDIIIMYVNLILFIIKYSLMIKMSYYKRNTLNIILLTII